ncbi:glycosyltransferase [Verrucosispora sp. TAA-831]|uniref:glycosyltransferase n=1 Tax=Verrucosispora sp. TAA-831 TaxID=3422227 RepID=UPI003D6DBDE3
MPVELQSLAVLNTAAFLLCVYFCAYVLSILVLHLRTQRSRGGDHTGFDWHIVIPCRNEASVIADTLHRLLRDLPDVTVWCVDDASDDGTDAVLHSFAADPRIRIISRRLPDAVQGKGAALNAAWQTIERHLPADADPERIILGVLDADSYLDPRCRSALAGPRYFGTATVAAVQVEVRMTQCARPTHGLGRLARLLVRLQDMEFRAPIAAMQSLRRHTASVAMGGNGQFTRVSLLQQLAAEHGTPWHGALLEDFELGLHILLQGSRTEYCAESWVAQEALTKIRPLIRQRTRWAQGSMQCGRYLAAVLQSRRISNSATLEITHFLAAPWFQLFGTPVYLGCLAVLAWYVSRTPGGLIGWWTAGGWGVLPLIVVFGVLPFAIWGLVYRNRCEPHLAVSHALGLGVSHWIYSYVQSVAVWFAFARMLTSRSEWQKTARGADQPAAPDEVPAPPPSLPTTTGTGTTATATGTTAATGRATGTATGRATTIGRTATIGRATVTGRSTVSEASAVRGTATVPGTATVTGVAPATGTETATGTAAVPGAAPASGTAAVRRPHYRPRGTVSVPQPPVQPTPFDRPDVTVRYRKRDLTCTR